MGKFFLSALVPFLLSAYPILSYGEARKESGEGSSLILLLLLVVAFALTGGSIYVFNFWTGAPWERSKARNNPLLWLQMQFISLTGTNPNFSHSYDGSSRGKAS